MKFLIPETFPRHALDLIRKYEEWSQSPHEILDVATEYGIAEETEVWLDCAGKQGEAHRPVIVMMGETIEANAVGRQAMRTSRCSFVIFSPGWNDQPWYLFAYKLLKTWPEITEKATEMKSKRRRCRIDVSVNGKLSIKNL